MTLTVNVPSRVILQQSGVFRLIAESPSGHFGLYPHRLDCIMPLVPGILVYEAADNPEQYLAVDEGVLVKTGLSVVVSVRSAVPGSDLKEMQTLVEQDFMRLGEQEQQVRTALARIEDEFVRMYQEVQHDRV